ncbi:hypothetical protein IWQ61_010434 [Dispira simplex]|nr:hypothetical protein IWQ61_010434 [Dispira simplex]
MTVDSDDSGSDSEEHLSDDSESEESQAAEPEGEDVAPPNQWEVTDSPEGDERTSLEFQHQLVDQQISALADGEIPSVGGRVSESFSPTYQIGPDATDDTSTLNPSPHDLESDPIHQGTCLVPPHPQGTKWVQSNSQEEQLAPTQHSTCIKVPSLHAKEYLARLEAEAPTSKRAHKEWAQFLSASPTEGSQ